MIPITCSASFLSMPPCGSRKNPADCDVDLCLHAARISEAVRLVLLGARAGLVCQLTGLEKAPANRLYRQLHGTPSPPGQMPFSDAWYRENDLRMLQATVVWRLYRQLTRNECDAARVLINVFEAYRRLVREPTLDLTRAMFVPRLVAMETWEERRCGFCRATYLAPVDTNSNACPGCRIYHRYRCRSCGSALEPRARGRRREVCVHCGHTTNGGTQH